MLSKEQELEALSWKCDQFGISYGKLVSKSSPEDIRLYYREYERKLARKQRKTKERIETRKSKAMSNGDHRSAVCDAFDDSASGHL